jgi:hypothetical protein
MSFKVGDIVMSNYNEDTIYIVVNTDKSNSVDLLVLVWATPYNSIKDLDLNDICYDIDIDILRKINLKDLTKRLVNYLLED